jgi:hypothetical protein
MCSNRDGGPEIRRCEVMRRRIVRLATKGTNHESKFAIYEYSLVTQRWRGHNFRLMRRPIVGLATNVLVSVGLGLAAGTAQAARGLAPVAHRLKSTHGSRESARVGAA